MLLEKRKNLRSNDGEMLCFLKNYGISVIWEEKKDEKNLTSNKTNAILWNNNAG